MVHGRTLGIAAILYAFAMTPSLDAVSAGNSPGPMAIIEGAVHDGRVPTGSAATVWLTGGEDGAWPHEMAQTIARATVDSAGRFRFERLHPGVFTVTASVPGRSAGKAIPVVATSGAVTFVDVSLHAGAAQLRGRVLDSRGAAVPKARLMITDSGGFASMDPPAAYETMTDTEGRYAVTLLSGLYTVEVHARRRPPLRVVGLHIGGNRDEDFRLESGSRICGRVTDGRGRGMRGTEVWAAPEEAVGVAMPIVRTDRHGAFTLDALPAGTYRVIARQARLVGLTEPLPVSSGMTERGAHITLVEGRAIRGRALSAAGQGLAGVRVVLTRAGDLRHGAMAMTSAPDGTFELQGLLPGAWRVVASASGHSPVETRVVLGRTQDKVGIDVTLTREAIVRGVVRDGDGRALAGQTVFARMPRATPAVRFALSDEEGRFEVRGFSAGALILTTHAPDRRSGAALTLALLAGDVRDVSLKLGPVSTISGSVRYEDGRPAPGVRVETLPSGDAEAVWPSGYAVTDAGGNYLVGPLDPGAVLLAAARRGSMMFFASPLSTPRQQSEILLAQGESKDGVHLIVRSGGAIVEGQVLGPQGIPVAGAVVVAAEERGGAVVRDPMPPGRSITDGAGAFVLRDLDRTTFTLWASHPGHPEAEIAHVFAGERNVGLSFPPSGSVAGVVLFPDGSPVTDFVVSALPSPRSDESAKHVQQWRQARGHTRRHVQDPDGRFTLRVVREGRHELRVVTAEGAIGSTMVSVRAGSTVSGLKVVIGTGVTVVGRVVHENGHAIPAAVVSAMVPRGARSDFSNRTRRRVHARECAIQPFVSE